MASLDQLMEFLEELKIEIAELKSGVEGDLVVSASQITISSLSELVAGEAGIPTGGKCVIAFTTSCPTGWTRVAALDSKFMRGATTYGGTGGGTHTHTGNNSHGHAGVGDHNHSTPGFQYAGPYVLGAGGNAHVDGSAGTSGGDGGHTHDNAGSGLSSATSEPPYVNFVFCSKD